MSLLISFVSFPSSHTHPYLSSAPPFQALYVEALYTITHKLGQGDAEESQESLYKYVRNAFQGDAQLHTALMEKAKQNKVACEIITCSSNVPISASQRLTQHLVVRGERFDCKRCQWWGIVVKWLWRRGIFRLQWSVRDDGCGSGNKKGKPANDRFGASR